MGYCYYILYNFACLKKYTVIMKESAKIVKNAKHALVFKLTLSVHKSSDSHKVLAGHRTAQLETTHLGLFL